MSLTFFLAQANDGKMVANPALRGYMLSVKQDQAKDIIDWLKIQITISSAAVGALLFSTKGQVGSNSLKLSALFFLLSMVLFIASIAGLIEHRDSSTPRLRLITAIPLMGGFTFFLMGFAAIVVVM
ncbi:hypothetical protein [Stutzerimonas stutzeri]|uniref:hypothetical protein n=1 Tax=Stutzerimonas stutzeri TaxID=316 RepID=UPI00265B5AD2|nr:hypothetical protein [Stutzerimonas stutzeri]MCF6782248.1 hypothetical protein [Stutzerimonas stutzeri]MCF6805432.1 hypothetical protein [Stutzerimonas stutzeri]